MTRKKLIILIWVIIVILFLITIITVNSIPRPISIKIPPSSASENILVNNGTFDIDNKSWVNLEENENKTIDEFKKRIPQPSKVNYNKIYDDLFVGYEIKDTSIINERKTFLKFSVDIDNLKYNFSNNLTFIDNEITSAIIYLYSNNFNPTNTTDGFPMLLYYCKNNTWTQSNLNWDLADKKCNTEDKKNVSYQSMSIAKSDIPDIYEWDVTDIVNEKISEAQQSQVNFTFIILAKTPENRDLLEINEDIIQWISFYSLDSSQILAPSISLEHTISRAWWVDNLLTTWLPIIGVLGTVISFLYKR